MQSEDPALTFTRELREQIGKEAGAQFKMSVLLKCVQGAIKAQGLIVVQGWQDIASAPRDEPILAAIRVTWQGGDPYWDRHIICIDSEEDRITDCDFDHGFEWDDYDLWTPLPAAPIAAAGEG